MKKNSKTPESVLVVTFDTANYGEYIHMTAREYWHNPEMAAHAYNEREQPWNHVYNYSDHYQDEHGERTTGIVISSQAHRDESNKSKFSQFYARRIELTGRMDNSRFDEIKRDIARIERAEKRYLSICQDFGTPATMTQFLVYWAKALSATLVTMDATTKELRQITPESLAYLERKERNDTD